MRKAGSLAEMEVFVCAVERGGFSPAARVLGMTPSGVSKLVSRLEERLGARLLNRSTRKIGLTPEGGAFYDRATRILADVEEAEREVAAGAMPRGRVRVSVNVPYGLHVLLPALARFSDRHPEITLDLRLTDRVIDLMDERADVAIRTGALPPSGLVARRLGESAKAVVASPSYLNRRGVPRVPADLEFHNCIGFNFARSVQGWPFQVDGVTQTLDVRGNMQVGDGETARRLALTGVGLARLARFHIGRDIEAGRLVPVLEPFNPGDVEPIHAVFLGHGGPLPRRVRAFVDYLAAEVSLGDDGERPARRGR